jgi:hypothetical protein
MDGSAYRLILDLGVSKRLRVEFVQSDAVGSWQLAVGSWQSKTARCKITREFGGYNYNSN